MEFELRAVLDYYKILGVKRTASAVEVKSAYRRLARQRHPDVNGGSEKAAREFALISRAYRTLSDPQERAHYDTQLSRYMNDLGASVLHSENPHARRLRRVAMQARMDRVVDQIIEAERKENFAMQQVVFTTVSLFLSTFFVAMIKPKLWHELNFLGRAVMLTLFVIGLWHLFSRMRAYFARYTYRPESIHDSIFNETGRPDKPFTRFAASSFLIIGYLASLAAGHFLGSHMSNSILGAVPLFFDQQLSPTLLLYPPIAVLVIDSMHGIAAKID